MPINKIFLAIVLIVIVGSFMAVQNTGRQETKTEISDGANEINLPSKNLEPASSGGKDPEIEDQGVDLTALPTIKSSELPAEDDPNRFKFVHGSWGNMDDADYVVTVNGDAIEEPISITYSEKVETLQQKSTEEYGEGDPWFDLIKNELQEYGNLAKYYLPDESITTRYQIDVDLDGIMEDLVTVCTLGANHCSDRSEIVKDGKVIFSAELGPNGIGFTPTVEGFCVEWTGDDSYQDEDGEWRGMCCPKNHHKTQFLYQNGKFEPVKQWKIEHVEKRVVD